MAKGRRRDQGAVKISCARQDPNARNCHGYRKFVKKSVLEDPQVLGAGWGVLRVGWGVAGCSGGGSTVPCAIRTWPTHPPPPPNRRLPQRGLLVNDTIVIRYQIELVVSSGGALSRSSSKPPLPQVRQGGAGVAASRAAPLAVWLPRAARLACCGWPQLPPCPPLPCPHHLLPRPAPQIHVPPQSLGLDLASLLQSGQGSDIAFEVEGEAMAAHKIILQARSPVFRALLTGPMREGHESKIDIQVGAGWPAGCRQGGRVGGWVGAEAIDLEAGGRMDRRGAELTARSWPLFTLALHPCAPPQDVRSPVFKALLYFAYTDSLPEDLQVGGCWGAGVLCPEGRRQ